MFNLRDFIMKGIRGMIGKEPEYKVIETAAGWLDKGVLTESDLAEVDELLTPTEDETIPADDIVDETAVMPDVPEADIQEELIDG